MEGNRRRGSFGVSAARRIGRVGPEGCGWLGSGRAENGGPPVDRDAAGSWSADMTGNSCANLRAVDARIHNSDALGCRAEAGRVGCAA